MPFAPRIRKDILKALDENIIPALWKQQVPLGYVAPPLQFPRDITKRLLRSQVPRADARPVEFPILSRWTKTQLLSTNYPYLSFIYEGIADERTFLTAAQANQHHIQKGIYALRWDAPGVLLFPPNTPRNAGTKVFWEDTPTPRSTVKILQLALHDDLLVHTSYKSHEQVQVSHPLQIKNASICNLANLFYEELRRHPADGHDTAQAVLLTLMLRLRDYLRSHSLNVANDAYPPVPTPQSFNKRNRNTWQEAADFIQMHLHEPLSVPLIARQVDASAAHLNNLFHEFSGTSVMRYVRQQRVAAAKVILEIEDESIKEIASVLNFKSSAAFCSVFRRETGLTPKQFRRKMAQD